MATKYDPQRHHRRSIRLKGWDYRTQASYFVTICTHQRQLLFNDPRFRSLAEYAWLAIPDQEHAKNTVLDEWVVMPNHVHGIILLPDREGVNTDKPATAGAVPGSLPVIVGNYKSLVTRRINNLRRSPGGKVWQRGYYERIVRNERELNAIREYIKANPSRWREDREYLDSLISKMHRK